MFVYIFAGIGDLLHYLMTKYADTDVQDKARLYYALMTGASDNKVIKTNTMMILYSTI